MFAAELWDHYAGVARLDDRIGHPGQFVAEDKDDGFRGLNGKAVQGDRQSGLLHRHDAVSFGFGSLYGLQGIRLCGPRHR